MREEEQTREQIDLLKALVACQAFSIHCAEPMQRHW